MQEPQLHWVKASASAAFQACVELADDGDWVALRNSRDTSVALRFTRTELAAFLHGVKTGEFDHLLHRSS
jgi:hypothetical protein